MLKPEHLFPKDFSPLDYLKTCNLIDIIGYLEKPAVALSSLNPKTSNEQCAYEVCRRDLAVLHYITTNRKVRTILEFGVGKSTPVFCHALHLNNQELMHDKTSVSLKTMCYSVDCHHEWIELTRSYLANLSLSSYSTITPSDSYVSTYNAKVCSYYSVLPSVVPDLIYLDGPHHNSPIGNIDGFSPSQEVGIPMAADILRIEYFFEPGCLIIVDGRTSNARFLKNNLQRCWAYLHIEEFDQHFFELQEPPLGTKNLEKLTKTLGPDFFDRSKFLS